MRSFAVFEAKNGFSELFNAVEHGEEISITRHGSPVDRQVAVSVGAEQLQRGLPGVGYAPWPADCHARCATPRRCAGGGHCDLIKVLCFI